MDVAENGIGHAPGEERDPCPLGANCGKKIGQRGAIGLKTGEQTVHPLEPDRQQLRQAQLIGQPIQPQRLRDAGRPEGEPHPFGKRKQPVKNGAVEEVGVAGLATGGIGPSLVGPKRLDEAPVLDARWAGGFATAAVETEVERAFDFGRQVEPTIDNRAHQIDAATGAVVFVARFEIGRAERRTQPTVDTVEKLFVVDVTPGTRWRRVWGGGRSSHIFYREARLVWAEVLRERGRDRPRLVGGIRPIGRRGIGRG